MPANTSVFALLFAASLAHADVVSYSENFESAALGSQSAGPSLSVQIDNVNQTGWQVLGGASASDTIAVTAGVDAQGVGGSHALFANWDFSGAAGSQFDFSRATITSLPGFAAGTTEAQIKVALDLFVTGAQSGTPLTIVFLGNNGNLPRGFLPTLANDAFTHVEFTLDQASGSAIDVTQPFGLQVLQHDAAAFGFDADNIVRIDNVSITAVPEPNGSLLVSCGALLLATTTLLRRRA